MKLLYGLFVISLSFNAIADNVLILRGQVPTTYLVQEESGHDISDHKDLRKHWRIVSNEARKNGGPRLSVSLQQNHYLVSLIHP
jgi:hypothetical protein